ncbi:MAG TPA: hypothetical protein VFM18_13630, partial [Methanosarcina sp.]|nr:hypothetical protein [Methanosarcina sp.]
MTTIAMNKDEIGCDLQYTHPSGYVFEGSSKIHELNVPALYPKGFYLGYAGSISRIQEVLNWIIDPTDKVPKSREHAEFVVLTKDKKMFTFTNPVNWIEIKDKYYTIGSGAQYAAGALAAGASITDALKIASKHDAHTGSKVKVF